VHWQRRQPEVPGPLLLARHEDCSIYRFLSDVAVSCAASMALSARRLRRCQNQHRWASASHGKNPYVRGGRHHRVLTGWCHDDGGTQLNGPRLIQTKLNRLRRGWQLPVIYKLCIHAEQPPHVLWADAWIRGYGFELETERCDSFVDKCFLIACQPRQQAPYYEGRYRTNLDSFN